MVPKEGVWRPLLIAAWCLSLMTGVGLAGPAAPLRLVRTIALDGVEGRIDHMALDASGQRLFLVALGNNTVEVLDLRSSRRLRGLTGFNEPQGVGFVTSPPRLFVANGGDGAVVVLDAGSLRVLRTVPIGEDADNIRVDEARARVYVGFGSGGLATLDARTGDVLGRVELPGHPESFQLETAGTRVFVNVPDADEVSVVDRTPGRVVAHWKLGGAKANFPMALDPAGKRVFVGCRQPARIAVLDAATGKTLSVLPIDGDADDLFFDARSQNVLASCGAGFIDVIAAPASGRLRVASRMLTAAGARTSLFDPEWRRLFLAVPHRGSQAAEVRVFGVGR